MADSAREYSDAQLNDMYDYLSDIFGQAEKDLQRKFQKYLADFARLEAQKREKLEAGEITQDEFDTWRRNKLLYGTHWTKLIKQVQGEMVKCNQTALDYINGKVPQIYAINYNHLAEVIPDSPVGGYTFELVNADTVRNIATSDKIMLPPPRKELNIPKDQLWNAKLVNAQLLQGILQGESIPKMAARMVNVCNSNKAAATRTARTMVTAAENGGRQSSINRATADGIILIKEWLATNDERTRDSHIAVNHQRVRCDATTEKVKKFSNGLAYPGDPNGEPAEVYNCRCTLITKYAGVDRKLLKKAIQRQAESENALLRKSRPLNDSEKNPEKAFKNLRCYDIIKKELGFISINDDILYMDEKLLEAQVEILTKLEKTFGIIHKTNTSLNYIFPKSNNQIAFTRMIRIYPRENMLNFNPYFYSDEKKYRKYMKDQSINWFMPHAKSDITKYNITHEYGHLLINYLLQNEYESKGWSIDNPDAFINKRALTTKGKYAWYTKTKKDFQKKCRKEIIAIAKKNNPEFKIKKNISDYGSRKDGEFLAEAFANSQLGQPNELGIAMQQWLKEKRLLL